jgi:hypothetical protein
MLGVVFDPPCFKDQSGVVDAPELGGVQAFIAEPVVEGFAEAVLPRSSRLNVVGGGTLGFEPLG